MFMEGITVVDLTEIQDERQVREEEQAEVEMFFEVDLERVFGSQSTAPEVIQLSDGNRDFRGLIFTVIISKFHDFEIRCCTR